MLLGEVLSRLSDEGFAGEALLGLGDLPLMVDVEAAGRRLGESGPLYVANAVRRFSALADDDDWLALMTALRHTADPGGTCLRHMLLWSLRQDNQCQHGS